MRQIFYILLACSFVISCSDDDNGSDEIASNVLAILQSETTWKVDYDNEVFEPPYNFEVYDEFQKFNGGTNPNGLREEYYLRYKQGETNPDCYRKSIMNESEFEDYYILSNDEQELIIYDPSGIEPNKLVYTYENGIMRYQYQEEGFDDFFPSATLTPSSVDVNSLNICN